MRRWQEDTGTAALAGYGLPAADVLTADQRLTARALRLRGGRPVWHRGRTARPRLPRRPARPGFRPAQLRRPVAAARARHSDCAAAHPPRPDLRAGSRRRVRARRSGAGPGTGRAGAADPGQSLLCDRHRPRQAGHRARMHPRPADPTSPGPGSGGLTVTVSTSGPTAPCDHRHQEPGYQPEPAAPGTLITGPQSPTCTAPGCRAALPPAATWTTPPPYAPRRPHLRMQPGLRSAVTTIDVNSLTAGGLTSPRPGVMVWTTVAGRRYVVPASG